MDLWSQGILIIPSLYLILKSSPILLSRSQNSPILSTLYQSLKWVYLYQVLLIQNHSICIYTSGLIVLGNPQKPMPSSQYTLANTDGLPVSDLRYLVSTLWPR